jgi:hypothetical protein
MYELVKSRRYEIVGGLNEARPLVAAGISLENDHRRAGKPFAKTPSDKVRLRAAVVEEGHVHAHLLAQASEQEGVALDDGQAPSAQEEGGDTPEGVVVRGDEDSQEMFPATGRMNKPNRALAHSTSIGRLGVGTLSVSSGGQR